MQPLNLMTLLYVVGGLILIGISIPLIQRQIKPNKVYGVRLPKTLANPDLWYDANAYFGMRAIVSGIAIVLAAVIFRLVAGITIDGYVTLCTTVILIGLVITMML